MIIDKFRNFNQKHLLVGLSVAAAFLMGKKCENDSSQQNMQNLTNQFIQKSTNYEKRIEKLEQKTKTFRFSDYNEDGVRLAEAEKIEALEYAGFDSRELDKLRVPELKVENIAKAGEEKAPNGENLAENMSLSEVIAQKQALKDSLVDLYQSGDTVKTLELCQRYKKISLQAMYVFSGKKHAHNLNCLEKSTEELNSLVKIQPVIMKTKAKAQVYKSKNAYIRDYCKVMLADEVLNYRGVVEMSNVLVDKMIDFKEGKERTAFYAEKRRKYAELLEKTRQKRLDEEMDKLLPAKNIYWGR